jgi:two-component system, chemotaxis family, protein-glutamate methylesterase/glutaminase
MAGLAKRQSPAHPAAHRHRVMLVDDSIVVRSITERIVESSGDFLVVASVPNAGEALEWLARDRCDLIILDIEMPGMSGIAALPLLLDRARGARIIILSANCEEGGPAAVEALARGAADTLLKPGRGTFAGTFGETLLERLRALASGSVAQQACKDASLLTVAAPLTIPESHPIAAIGIGASTGGIMAINGLLAELAPHVDCPIFITQHLPGGFIPFFADQLRRIMVRPVMVADDGMAVQPGTIYLAPGDAHLRLALFGAGTRIMLDRTPSANGACPSVDPMMMSLAAIYGTAACAVILSGMGRDGHNGVAEIRKAGGLVLAQDVGTSVVWGMPGAVARSGFAKLLMPPEDIGRYISQVAGMVAKEPVANSGYFGEPIT